jgi:hypothetical protein|tara:strand:- start:8220 stop:8393 length:174 start_codon:yes stop_codon:yes gene_type:complete
MKTSKTLPLNVGAEMMGELLAEWLIEDEAPVEQMLSPENQAQVAASLANLTQMKEGN